jgi:hypothetical protein
MTDEQMQAYKELKEMYGADKFGEVNLSNTQLADLWIELKTINGQLNLYKDMYERSKPTEFDKWREKKFGKLGRHMFDI